MLNERIRTLLLLLAVLTICLLSGAWLQQKLVVTIANSGARTQAWREMSRETQLLLSEEHASSQKAGASRAGSSESAASSKTASRFLRVDQEWRRQPSDGGTEQTKPVGWITDIAASQTLQNGLAAGTSCGFVLIAGERRLAIAQPLPNGRGYLVAHRSLDGAPIAASQYREALFWGSVVSIVWTLGVMSIGVFMIIWRIYEKFSHRHNRAETAAIRHAEATARTRDAIIFGLAKLTESRDPETGHHLERIAAISSKLADAMRNHSSFSHLVTPEFVRLIELSSTLHDIGKVGIEDRVLLKPGRLNDEERQIIQKHAVIGGKCIQDIERRLGSSNFLQLAREIAFSHHEKWDGSGYPSGLAGEEIPLSGRIVAVADVYDALSSRRCYKEPMSHEECVKIIREEAGAHFDPRIVEVFLQVEPQIRLIRQRLADPLEKTERSMNQPPAKKPADPIITAEPEFDSPQLAGTAAE